MILVWLLVRAMCIMVLQLSDFMSCIVCTGIANGSYCQSISEQPLLQYNPHNYVTSLNFPPLDSKSIWIRLYSPNSKGLDQIVVYLYPLAYSKNLKLNLMLIVHQYSIIIIRVCVCQIPAVNVLLHRIKKYRGYLAIG